MGIRLVMLVMSVMVMRVFSDIWVSSVIKAITLIWVISVIWVI